MAEISEPAESMNLKNVAMTEVYFTLDETPEELLQLSINHGRTGYRIFGPKYNGRSRNIKKHVLTSRDVEQIKRYLRYATKEK